MSIDTVVFDLDGVVIDTEEVWNAARHDFAVAHGGHWDREYDQPAVMGANSLQWATWMREQSGVDLPVEEIYAGVVEALRRSYAQHLPLIPGAREVITSLVGAYKLGVASSSPLELIEYVLELADLRRYFAAVVSSDDVEKGKPEPHVYLEACARLGARPERAAAVEDSSSGIQAAAAAGLVVIAVPNAGFPPPPAVLAAGAVVLGSVSELTAALVSSLGAVGR
ncbi:MAG: HAD family phosphatase [Thermoleophilia bacterium]|nr:HAD family phosphatase [Thermoleophilia bacterium]